MEGIMMDERNGKKNYVPNVFWGKYLNQVLSYEEEISQRRSSRPPNPPIGGAQANFGDPS